MPEKDGLVRKLVIEEFTESTIRPKQYKQYFADVLACAHLLRAYLRGKPDFSQSVAYPSAIKYACRILNIDTHQAPNGRNYWRLRANSESFLRAAGLDVETLEIVDLDRARACWFQLIETRLFRPERQAEFLERVRRGETPVRDAQSGARNRAQKTVSSGKKWGTRFPSGRRFSREEAPENNPFNYSLRNAIENKQAKRQA